MGKKSKAQNAQAHAYWDELSKVTEAKAEVKRMDANGARDLRRQYGAAAGGEVGRLARKADKTAKTINSGREKYMQGINDYNERVKMLKMQMGDRAALGSYVAEKTTPLKQELAKLQAEETAYQKTAPQGKAVWNSFGLMGREPAPLTQEQIARAKRIQELNSKLSMYEDAQPLANGRGPGGSMVGKLQRAFDDISYYGKKAEGYQEAAPTAQALRGVLPSTAQGGGMIGGFSVGGGIGGFGLPQKDRDSSNLTIAPSGPASNDAMKANIGQYNDLAEQLKAKLTNRVKIQGQQTAAGASGMLANAALAGSDLASQQLANK